MGVKGCTREKRIKNKDDRWELVIFNFSDRLEQNKLKRKQQIEETRLPKITGYYKPKGKSDVAKPRNR